MPRLTPAFVAGQTQVGGKREYTGEPISLSLRDNDIKVVLHKWVPSEAIQSAVRAAGAELVVLDAGDPGVVVDRALAPDGLQQILRKNLDAIVAAAGH